MSVTVKLRSGVSFQNLYFDVGASRSAIEVDHAEARSTRRTF